MRCSCRLERQPGLPNRAENRPAGPKADPERPKSGTKWSKRAFLPPKPLEIQLIRCCSSPDTSIRGKMVCLNSRSKWFKREPAQVGSIAPARRRWTVPQHQQVVLRRKRGNLAQHPRITSNRREGDDANGWTHKTTILWQQNTRCVSCYARGMQETRSYLFLILNILKTSLRLNPFLWSNPLQ